MKDASERLQIFLPHRMQALRRYITETGIGPCSRTIDNQSVRLCFPDDRELDGLNFMACHPRFGEAVEAIIAATGTDASKYQDALFPVAAVSPLSEEAICTISQLLGNNGTYQSAVTVIGRCAHLQIHMCKLLNAWLSPEQQRAQLLTEPVKNQLASYKAAI